MLSGAPIRATKPARTQFKLYDEGGLFLIVKPSGGKPRLLPGCTAAVIVRELARNETITLSSISSSPHSTPSGLRSKNLVHGKPMCLRDLAEP